MAGIDWSSLNTSTASLSDTDRKAIESAVDKIHGFLIPSEGAKLDAMLSALQEVDKERLSTIAGRLGANLKQLQDLFQEALAKPEPRERLAALEALYASAELRQARGGTVSESVQHVVWSDAIGSPIRKVLSNGVLLETSGICVQDPAGATDVLTLVKEK